METHVNCDPLKTFYSISTKFKKGNYISKPFIFRIRISSLIGSFISFPLVKFSTHQKQMNPKETETNGSIFKEIKTSFENKSVFELSKEHRIVGVFIKWFGCPM
jgi:hypothetical protein